jgi:predicted nucleotide-binding protein
MLEKFPPHLEALSTSISRSLEKTFGVNTSDYRRYSDAAELLWTPIAYFEGVETPLSDYRSGVAENIRRSETLLSEAIRSLREDLSELEAENEQAAKPNVIEDSRRIFIVHGHDEGARETIARFVEQLGLDPVILHEQPNKGRTIITKFQEEARDVGFAIVLMTPDDQGGPVRGEQKPRSRQNVVFELGFFIGAIGANRVAALLKGNLERPSDFDGVVYISMDTGSWRHELGRELQAAGFDIDWNIVMR